ncbi:MAG: thymidine phosphorylase [Thermaerobacter sp.]|nr:thymidine phosphorylase [Thermaerobacter sp.]
MLNAVSLIERKRDGGVLSRDEIAGLVEGYVDGTVPDYQMSAFLMAVTIQGLNFVETAALTDAMLHSGRLVDVQSMRPLVDKHSTGGVGDKTSLVAAPLLVALGFSVPKLSGRGLGHTGGTLDKLESIPGLRTDLAPQEFAAIVGRFGLAIAAQSKEIVPADQKLYALRDVTGTVQSLPLIASSIMSKKLAVSSRLIVLDVKVGDGAFFTDLRQAEEFASLAIALGQSFGRATRAVLTSMDAPLGRNIGNALEVAEAIRCLRGEGPEDLAEVAVALAAEALCAVRGDDWETARGKAADALRRGEAYERFRRWVTTQGGDPRVVDDPSLLPRAPHSREITAHGAGYVARLAARTLGDAARLLGAGRLRKEDAIDLGAGIEILRGVGEPVANGEPVLRLFAGSEEQLDAAQQRLSDAVVLAETVPPARSRILRRMEGPTP